MENLHEADTNELVNVDELARQLACGIVSRKLYEKRHGDNTPDDTLVGALQLLCCVMKQQPLFKNSPEGQEFLLHLLECLFALPSPREKNQVSLYFSPNSMIKKMHITFSKLEG